MYYEVCKRRKICDNCKLTAMLVFCHCDGIPGIRKLYTAKFCLGSSFGDFGPQLVGPLLLGLWYIMAGAYGRSCCSPNGGQEGKDRQEAGGVPIFPSRAHPSDFLPLSPTSKRSHHIPTAAQTDNQDFNTQAFEGHLSKPQQLVRQKEKSTDMRSYTVK